MGGRGRHDVWEGMWEEGREGEGGTWRIGEGMEESHMGHL